MVLKWVEMTMKNQSLQKFYACDIEVGFFSKAEFCHANFKT